MPNYFKFLLLLVAVIIAGGAVFSFGLEKLYKSQGNTGVAALAAQSENSISAPKEIKAVYFTSWTAGRKKSIDYLINLANTTEINAAVIDIKDTQGYIAYKTSVPELENYTTERIGIRDIGALLKKLHDNGIYAIARISVFQDPALAATRADLTIRQPLDLSSLENFVASLPMALNRGSTNWVDPASRDVWYYNIALAKDAILHGFDEVNFDYVRFPSEGNLKSMIYPFWDKKTPKSQVIREFLRTINKELPNDTISIDFFGLTTINKGDLGVGQVIEDAYENFDYIAPMVYPSHYASGFLGFQNPADYPYEVIKYSMENAGARLEVLQKKQREAITATSTNKSNIPERSPQLRPWLQSFNLGAVYDAEMIVSEINATRDALGDNFRGFMLWNPSNVYIKDSLESESQKSQNF